MSDSVALKLRPVIIPNYIMLESLRWAQLSHNAKVAVADLNDEQKDWLAQEFRTGLDRVAKRQIKTRSIQAKGATP